MNAQARAVFQRRRRAYLDRLGSDFALLLAGPDPQPLHRLRRYRPERSLYYLTGWDTPGAAALFRPGTELPFVLFIDPRDPEHERWTGAMPGLEGAVRVFGADAAFPLERLGELLVDLLQGAATLHYALGQRPEVDGLVLGAVEQARPVAERNGLHVPDAFVLHNRLLHEMRVVKDESEIENMRRAAWITSDGLRRALLAARAGQREYSLQAEVEAGFMRHGALPAFETMVATGDRALVLHPGDKRGVLRSGDLVLIDAGCEVAGYAADVTRTFPVSGRFDPAQRQAYQIVSRARVAALDAVRPGVGWARVQDAAVSELVRGLVAIGVLREGAEADARAHLPYVPHAICHWLGLDVHDVGRYYVAGRSRELQPGMVLAIEPGLYLPADDPAVPPPWRGMALRVEDVVLVTQDGAEVLSGACPWRLEELEALLLSREGAEPT